MTYFSTHIDFINVMYESWNDLDYMDIMVGHYAILWENKNRCFLIGYSYWETEFISIISNYIVLNLDNLFLIKRYFFKKILLCKSSAI